MTSQQNPSSGTAAGMSRLLSKRTLEPKNSPGEHQVPLAVFDFNELRDVTAVPKVRRMVAAATATVLAAASVVIVGGLFGWVASSANSDAATVEDEVVIAARRTAAIVGGDERIPDHVTARERELAAVRADTVDVTALMGVVTATAPSGVTVTDVSLTASTDPEQPDKKMLSITAAVSDFELIKQWRANLDASPAVVVTTDSLSSDGTLGTATMTVELAPRTYPEAT